MADAGPKHLSPRLVAGAEGRGDAIVFWRAIAYTETVEAAHERNERLF